MVKARIYIYNDDAAFHESVSEEIQLAARPMRGEVIYLDEDIKTRLQEKARKLIDKFWPGEDAYQPYLMWADKTEGKRVLNFSEAMYVKKVGFFPNEHFIRIILDRFPQND